MDSVEITPQSNSLRFLLCNFPAMYYMLALHPPGEQKVDQPVPDSPIECQDSRCPPGLASDLSNQQQHTALESLEISTCWNQHTRCMSFPHYSLPPNKPVLSISSLPLYRKEVVGITLEMSRTYARSSCAYTPVSNLHQIMQSVSLGFVLEESHNCINTPEGLV